MNHQLKEKETEIRTINRQCEKFEGKKEQFKDKYEEKKKKLRKLKIDREKGMKENDHIIQIEPSISKNHEERYH